MISITNNAASIQLNGDQNVTIVKRDVTKVQSVGINVLVVRRTNGIERKTSIPYTSVNVPQTFPTAQALADYISSILGSFDTSSFIENSNATYVAQVISSPFPIPDTDIENSDGSYTNSIPSADPTPFVIPDVTIENSDASYSNAFPSATTSVLPDIDVLVNSNVEGQVPSVIDVEIELEDSGGNPVSPTSVNQSGNTFTIEVPSAGLTVNFSADDTTPETNQTVTFTDATVGATSWLWDFGDGNLSTLQNPTHAYKTTGTYTVTLYASDGTAEGVEVKSNYIVVSLEAELTTNLFASYNADDWVDDGSGNASQWNDSSGNAFHLTNGGAANRPQILASQINGFGGLSFNGVNQWLQNSDVLMSIGDCTYYVVFERKRITTEVLLAAFSSSNYRSVLTSTTEMAYRLRQVTQGGWVSYGNNVDRYVIGAFRFTSADGAIQFFSLQPYEGIGINPSVAETGLYLCRNSIGGYMQAIVSEVKVYNVAHTAAEISQVIQRLSAKFNKYE